MSSEKDHRESLRRIRMIHLVGRQVSRSLIILPLLYLTDGRRKGQTLCMP